MRKKDEKQHKKGQETTIGKIIYGFLLFMPLFAIGVTCGYAMFNKNAYQSYSDQYTSNITEITTTSQYLEGLTIQFNYRQNEQADNYSNIMYIKNLSFNPLDYGYSQSAENYDRVQFYPYQSGNTLLRLYNKNTNETENKQIWGETLKTFSVTLTQNLPSNANLNSVYYAFTFSYTTNKVSDVFYYSVDKVTESPLFNWAENSIIYTTTNATCNALSITTSFIPLLLSYWLIISVIYFLYDIALMLVWMIHRKIHELQESL